MKPICELFLIASCLAADPLPAPDQKAPPRIVASPTSVQPVIPAGTPVALDVGRFVWLDVTNVSSPVSFDFSVPGIVALLPDPPAGATVADYFPGVKQGEAVPAFHKFPSKTAVPCLGVAEGKVTIAAWGVEGGRAKKLAELTVQVGPRGPPDDVVPEPKPQPIGTNPFSNQFGLHVLIVFDGTEPESQKSIIYGAKVREYLNAKCGVGPDGKTRTYRIWPNVTDATGEAKVWTDAFAKTNRQRRILIGNGPNGYDGEMPASADEMLKLLQKYGG